HRKPCGARRAIAGNAAERLHRGGRGESPGGGPTRMLPVPAACCVYLNRRGLRQGSERSRVSRRAEPVFGANESSRLRFMNNPGWCSRFLLTVADGAAAFADGAGGFADGAAGFADCAAADRAAPSADREIRICGNDVLMR